MLHKIQRSGSDLRSLQADSKTDPDLDLIFKVEDKAFGTLTKYDCL